MNSRINMKLRFLFRNLTSLLAQYVYDMILMIPNIRYDTIYDYYNYD